MSEDQYVVLGGGQHIDQIGDLGIGTVHRRLGDNAGIEPGIFRLQCLHHIDGGIGLIMHAEHNLDRGGKILGKETFQIFLQPRFSQV